MVDGEGTSSAHVPLAEQGKRQVIPMRGISRGGDQVLRDQRLRDGGLWRERRRGGGETERLSPNHLSAKKARTTGVQSGKNVRKELKFDEETMVKETEVTVVLDTKLEINAGSEMTEVQAMEMETDGLGGDGISHTMQETEEEHTLLLAENMETLAEAEDDILGEELESEEEFDAFQGQEGVGSDINEVHAEMYTDAADSTEVHDEATEVADGEATEVADGEATNIKNESQALPGKKQVVRKKTSKTNAGVGVGTMRRMTQAAKTPRKKASSKVVSRPGKKTEAKGDDKDPPEGAGPSGFMV
ncbi:unnamed protein product [Microthlaspi erraticum]|uniref:Uncharacterized protein n=1 Tax=Microthlaspi erraticum TaxID=1685480 RepID=A0A6D2K9Z6_9BRAS|nr:unnamed protein product [Microthlaspi erraticum]